MIRLIFITFVLICVGLPAQAAPKSISGHAISMHGHVALADGFKHFPHANPEAPKGGRLRLALVGGFDSLNPFIVRGVVPEGVKERVFQSLLTRSPDEPFTLYEGLAEQVDMAEDRKSITFFLNPAARWGDGKAVTQDDVIFTWQTLKTKGRPNHRHFYGQVDKVEKIGAHGVRFTFGPEGNRESPLILALMPILPRHVYAGDSFAKTWSEAPIGSGPYAVAEIDLGHRLLLRRKMNWWGANRPVNVGRYNFDEIEIINFRNRTAAFEAFKAGEVDAWFETDVQKWATEYDFPAARSGDVVKREFANEWPTGMLGIALNTRRPLFQNRAVRDALIHAFDFEWMNRVYFHGAYARANSFFSKSALAGVGPASAAELALAKKVGAVIDAEGYTPPRSDGSGRNRTNLRTAQRLLKQAGQGPFSFEILLNDPAQERIMLAWAASLKKLGIELRIRTVDSAQFEARRADYDFDAMVYDWGQSLSPGNEQSFYWGAGTRARPGTRNYFGVEDPAIDKLITRIVDARSYDDLTLAVKVMDRALLQGRYVVPLYYSPVEMVAHAKKIHLPESVPMFGIKPDRWWYGE